MYLVDECPKGNKKGQQSEGRQQQQQCPGLRHQRRPPHRKSEKAQRRGSAHRQNIQSAAEVVGDWFVGPQQKHVGQEQGQRNQREERQTGTETHQQYSRRQRGRPQRWVIETQLLCEANSHNAKRVTKETECVAVESEFDECRKRNDCSDHQNSDAGHFGAIGRAQENETEVPLAEHNDHCRVKRTLQSELSMCANTFHLFPFVVAEVAFGVEVSESFSEKLFSDEGGQECPHCSQNEQKHQIEIVGVAFRVHRELWSEWCFRRNLLRVRFRSEQKNAVPKGET